MSERVGFALLLAVVGLFVGAGLLALNTNAPSRFVGAILIAAGFIAVAFSRAIATAQQALAKKPYIPQHWKGVRPLTYTLWGSGVAILGVLLLLGWG